MQFTDTFLKIGNPYYDHNKDIESFKIVLSLYEKTKGQTSVEFTDTLLVIGNTYYDHNKCYLAIDYYNKALSIYEK